MTETRSTSPRLPLSGVRILDLTVMTAGPVGTMLLADMGADVIKVEEIEAGDLSRGIGTVYIKGESAQFMSENRNKRSMRLDLKHPEGRALFLRLAKECDVICENFRAGTVDRLGIGYDAVREVRPDVVYASISAFGQSGPYAKRPANDPIVQALGGIMAATGEADGEPVRLGYPYPDFGAAALLAFAISTALLHRERSGEGQRIELSLLEGVVFSSIPRDGETLITGRAPERRGSAHGSFAPYQNFKGADGAYFFLSCFTERMWTRLCDALEEPGWKSDPRFARNPARVENQALLAAELQARFSTAPAAVWVERLSAFDVPAAKVQDLHEALRDDPQLAENGVLVELEHPRAGRIEGLAHPVHFRGTPAAYRRPPPVLGEHSREVLSELGLAETEIEGLLASGAIRGADPLAEE